MSKSRLMAHAIGLATLGFTAACAMPAPGPTTSLADLQPQWYYQPGPHERIQETSEGPRRTIVSAERDGAWTVSIGQPPTTVAVQRLADGRPATVRIANAERNETAVFDPPLALVPAPGAPAPATETAALALYKGLHPAGVPDTLRPTRTGTAQRQFLGVTPQTWIFEGRRFPAQELRHELVLELGPVQIRQSYQSLAVQGQGIVRETVAERVGFLGVRIQSRQTTFQATDLIDIR